MKTRPLAVSALALAAALTALTGCAPAGPVSDIRLPGFAGLQAGPTVASISRDSQGRFEAVYELDREAPVWAFRRSALSREGRRPWRLDQWRVITPGVTLSRVGFYDVLTADDGGPVPRQVRVALTPVSADVEADYDPALMFSTGDMALYTDHFDVIPYDRLAQVQALPSDLNEVSTPGSGPVETRFRDARGPVLFRGERVAEAVGRNADTYVLFGAGEASESRGVAAIVDPGLPGWIGDELETFTPRILDYYAQRLGPKPGATPTVMVSWRGPSSGRNSLGGSVMNGLIVMTFEGSGLTRVDPSAIVRSRWFIGHEAAHFWLGQAVRYQFARDAWITEGGADLMAVRGLKALDPSYNARAELQNEVNDCTRLAVRPVAEAGDRGEHRAYYACGAVFAMAAEGAQAQRSGGDYFDFLRPLIDANRRDGVLTREEWLSALTRTSRDPSLRLDVERLLDQGASDPAAVIARLFQRTGVAHRVENGRVALL